MFFFHYSSLLVLLLLFVAEDFVEGRNHGVLRLLEFELLFDGAFE
jgi:hypothetical protein